MTCAPKMHFKTQCNQGLRLLQFLKKKNIKPLDRKQETTRGNRVKQETTNKIPLGTGSRVKQETTRGSKVKQEDTTGSGVKQQTTRIHVKH